MTPENCRYSKDHEWVRPDGDDHVKIGITDYAQGELGDIVFVELPVAGTSLEVGQPFGSIEAVKTVSDMNSPISGEVVEANDAVANDPSVANQSPYEDGWFIRARLSNPSELEGLLSASDYEEFVKGLEG